MTKEEAWIDEYKDEIFISPSYGKAWWIKSGLGRKVGYEVGGSDSDNKYKRVQLNKQMIELHRIIWTLKNGKIPYGFQIHHKDENRSNNRIDNLELIEKSGHMSMHIKGEKNPHHKLTQTQVENIRIEKEDGSSCNTISRKYKISLSQTSRILKHKRWT